MQSAQMLKIVCNRSFKAYHRKSNSLSNSSSTSGKKEPTVSNLTLSQPLDWLQMQFTVLPYTLSLFTIRADTDDTNKSYIILKHKNNSIHNIKQDTIK